MLRKLIFVVSAVALTLVSCGRQVTPDRTGTSAGGLQPGQMQIKFNTYQPMDFTNVWYVIALNTSGTGGEPYAINGNAAQNWFNYSFEIIVYQLAGQSAPQAAIIQFLSEPGIGGGTVKQPSQPLTVAQQQLQLIPNCNGSQTQLCLTIDRAIFNGIVPSGTSSPPPLGTSFYINWFTVNPTSGGGVPGQVIDAPGQSGPTDASWLPPNPPSHVYDTTIAFDYPWTAVQPPGWPQVNPAPAQIAGGEVLNNP